jgi:type I restriction enzyme S subunit
MSKLKKLISELSPDGVIFKNLRALVSYEQPSKYIVNSTKYNNSYDTPVLTAGQSLILGYTDEITGIYKASELNPVIIFDDFTTSFHWITFNFKVKFSAMKLLTLKNNDIALFRYVFYAMKCIKYTPVNHTRQWIEVYSNFKIPFPPLPIQEEIVRILDGFSELQAEQQARKAQYEYYLDKLLTFKESV